MDWTKVLESVAASGPLAGVLLAAVWVLWKRGIDKEAAHQTALDNKDKAHAAIVLAKDLELQRLNDEHREFVQDLLTKTKSSAG